MSTVGIVGNYLFHAAAILMLCRSRYGAGKTRAVCGVMAAVQIGVAFGVGCFLKGKALVYVVFLATFAILLLEIFWLSSESFPKTMFLCMTYVQAFMVVTYLSGIVSNWLFDGRIDATAYVRLLLHGTILAVYGMEFRKRFEEARQEITEEGWWPLCVLSILYTGYMCCVVMAAQASYFHSVDLLIFILLLAAVIIGYWVIFRTIHYMREAAMSRQIEQRQKILSEKLTLMEKAEEDARRIRHDLHHHLQNIAEYAKAGDREALLRYLGEYEEEVEKTQTQHFSPNSTLDHILSVYANEAHKAGIRTDFHAPVKENIGIGELDLVAVLANLLENSLHGCLESGRKDMKIRVRIRLVSEKLFILVGNSCSDGLSFTGGLPDRKGVGISSILQSVGKYRGDADFSCGEGWFTARIIMKCR